MDGLLTRRAKDKYFPGVLQAIVLALQNRCCGCEEPGQVFEDLRWRCHDVMTRQGIHRAESGRRRSAAKPPTGGHPLATL
jgi:hypothetical protein